MKIILIENIRELGQIGDIKEVSSGYARNFLMPKNLGILATKENLKRVGELKEKKAISVKQEIEKMKQASSNLKDLRLIIESKADEKGHLYAAINSKKISDTLKEKGIEINSDYILIAEPIKKTGAHSVLFKCYDIETLFEVEVIRV